MQSTARPKDWANGNRTKHTPKISISDDNHHVTDAISSLYDYGEQYGRPGQRQQEQQSQRPLSFLPSPRGDQIAHTPQSNTLQRGSPMSPTSAKSALSRGSSASQNGRPVDGQYANVARKSSLGVGSGGGHSPPLGGRTTQIPAATANTSFPLNDIDYESNPAAVAQELSNLQALRRMSMDVNTAADPDLPNFNNQLNMPALAPTGAEGQDSTSSLYWVPARLHPELAPQEFKTFIDNRFDAIKRRSGEFSLIPDGPSRSSSGGGLRRKKSMLSRQIDNTGGRGGEGYQDGAERLDRKRSLNQEPAQQQTPSLLELETLVNDPAKVIQRLSIESKTPSSGKESPTPDDDMPDMPILPAAPGNSLKRSTRTTYRRGSLKKGERVPPSKRALKTAPPETGGEDSAVESPVISDRPPTIPEIPSGPADAPTAAGRPMENFSRPGRINRNRGPDSVPAVHPVPTFSFDLAPGPPSSASPSTSQSERTSSLPQPSAQPPIHASNQSQSPPQLHPQQQQRPQEPPLPRQFVSSFATNGRSTVQLDRNDVPKLSEPAPPQRPGQPTRQSLDQSRSKPFFNEPIQRPERSSMPDQSQLTPNKINPRITPASQRIVQRGQPQPSSEQQTVQHMAAHPSPLPGSSSTRTDSLTFIPTLTEDKKAEVKKSGKRDVSDGKKSSWSWGSLLGGEEKDKDKKKDEPPASKLRSKQGKAVDKPHDNTRLDVLQTTMEGSRGRESLAIDRNDIKLEEERRKESGRRSAEGKKEKEKEGGLLSSLFGGGKKKGERDSSSKRSARTLSPEPPRAPLRPDIDYHWTRFSILEERAIYRMAHIKLANPRRALYSQVLLSNFMYSYLAKVQQMHPQIQIPQSAAQKRQQQQQQQKSKDQPEEFQQYQRYQEQQAQQDRLAQQAEETTRQSDAHDYGQSPYDENGDHYMDDAYGYQQGQENDDNSPHRPSSRPSQQPSRVQGDGNYGYPQYGYDRGPGQVSNPNHGYSTYDQQQKSMFERDSDDNDEMW